MKQNIKTRFNTVMQKFFPFLKKTSKAVGKGALKVTKNTYIQFVFLGVILVVLQMIGAKGLLDVSLLRNIGITIIFTIAATGLYILLGFAGLASLGTAGFVGLGAYMTAYCINNGIAVELALVICIFAAIILGIIVGFISLRIEGMYLGIITLGLSEILVSLFRNLDSITGGINGMKITDKFYLFKYIFGNAVRLGSFPAGRVNTFYVLVAVFILLLCLARNITNSPTGRAMLTMKNSESAAQSMGIGLLRYRLLAFVIATVFAMIAGFLYMIYMPRIYPSDWTLAFSLNILAVVVVGGTKSIWGFLTGAFMIFGLNNLVLQNIDLFVQNPTLSILFNGALMVLVVMFYPGGFSQLYLEIGYKIKLRKMKGAKAHAK
ncbi:MAG: branched-chain amino acid ABC transporter permease [Firmicutes bacterium]|nr:branched-chain amino acid ABC transporter permease [Bacillota bacterium]